jgi:hypothetical protein
MSHHRCFTDARKKKLIGNTRFLTTPRVRHFNDILLVRPFTVRICRQDFNLFRPVFLQKPGS